MNNAEKLVSYDVWFSNNEKDEADRKENGERTEVAEDEESEYSNDIIEGQIRNPNEVKEEEFS